MRKVIRIKTKQVRLPLDNLDFVIPGAYVLYDNGTYFCDGRDLDIEKEMKKADYLPGMFLFSGVLVLVVKKKCYRLIPTGGGW